MFQLLEVYSILPDGETLTSNLEVTPAPDLKVLETTPYAAWISHGEGNQA